MDSLKKLEKYNILKESAKNTDEFYKKVKNEFVICTSGLRKIKKKSDILSAKFYFLIIINFFLV